MSITKATTVDQITVTENGIIQVRQVTRIMEDGQQLSSSYHRWSLTPGQDVTDQPANVQAIAAAAWTPAVVAAYTAAIEAASAARNAQ